MREIKFRGKTTIKENDKYAFNNIWVYGDLITNKDKYYIHPQGNTFQVNNELGKLFAIHEVIPETIEQYTGLQDKNGKEIYEGDIVKIEAEGLGGEAIGKIVYDEYDLAFVLANPAEELYECLWYAEQQIEVIGNIYENSNLLEEG